MGLLRDRAVGHRPGLETLHDCLDRLDFLDRYGSAVLLEFHQPAQGREILAAVVDLGGILLVDLVAAGAHRLLEEVDGLGVEEVVFPVTAPLVDPAGVEGTLFGIDVTIREGLAMTHERLLGDLLEIGAFATARGAGEEFVHKRGAEADRLKDLRAAVGGDGGDPHLRHGLDDALDRTLEEVVDRLVELDVEHVFLDHPVDRVEGHVGIDRVGPVADEGREVVHLAGLAGFENDRDLGAGALLDEVVVQASHDEKRRHGRVLRVDVAIGENEEIAPVGDHRVGLEAERIEGFLQSLASVVGGEKGVEGGRLEAIELDLAQLRELLVVEERMIDADHAAALRSGLEEVALGSEEGLRSGDELLTNTIERRIRDLGEDLFEILVEVFRLLREHREGRVIAHRADRLHAGGRGGPEEHAQILVGVAEGELALEDALFLDRLRGLRGREILEENAVLVEPLLVGLRGVDALFHLVVGDDAAFLHVHEEHTTGAETPFLHDRERVDVGDNTHLRGHDDEVVLGYIVAARAETVAVEDRADHLSVGEGDRGRAVPRLHEAGVVFVEGLFLGLHEGVALPRLGDHHHDRVDEVVSAEVHEFQRVVKAGGVRPILVDDGEDVLDPVAVFLALAEGLARLHEVRVAHHRVDLAIVGDETVGVRAGPAREGVRRETRVHQRQRRLEIRIVEIGEIIRELAGREHALVDHRLRRQVRDVEISGSGKGIRLVAVNVGVTVGQLVVADRVGDAAADDVELALEIPRIGDLGILPDEDLADRGLVAARGLAEDLALHRHGAPADELLALFTGDVLEDLHRRLALARLGGKKDETGPIFALGRKLDSLLRHFLAEKFVRDLHEHACAVAGERIRPARAAVVHILVHRQRFQDDVVRPFTLQMGDKADAAGVFLMRRMPEALRFGPAKRGGLRNRHGVQDE